MFDVKDILYDLMCRCRVVGVVWTLDDVREVRPDLTDDEQAWEVLVRAGHKYSDGPVTPEAIELAADDLYPLHEEVVA